MEPNDQYTITEVRHGLSSMRQMWRENSPFTPMNQSQAIGVRDLSAANFAFQLVYNNKRKKRCQKLSVAPKTNINDEENTD